MSAQQKNTKNAAIQGLRAVAVIFVILFHLDIEYFKRGFLGVDIFFTISGFVVFYANYHKIESTPDIWDFVKRRFFRLFPASAVTVLFTVLIGFTFLLYTDKISLLKDAVAALFAVLNIKYLISINYFSADTDFRPLLHFWSLSLEEQFYVLFLIIFIIKLKTSDSTIMMTVVGLTALSLLLSILISRIHAPFDFFNPVTRAWQFGFGIIAAYLVRTRPLSFDRRAVLITNYILLALLAIISIAGISHYLVVDQVMIATIISVLCYLNISNYSKTILNTRIPCFIGNMSYSLYLVHWPIVVYLNMVIGRDTVLNGIIIPSVLIGIFGCALFYQVERGWREWSRAALMKRGLRLSALALAGLLLSGLVMSSVYRDSSLEFREQARALVGLRADLRQECTEYIRDYHHHGRRCIIDNGPANETKLLLGDSHAGPFIPMLNQLETYNFDVYIATGCVPLPAIDYDQSDYQQRCGGFFEKVLDDNRDTKDLYIFGRWNGYEGLIADSAQIAASIDALSDRHKLHIVQQPEEFEGFLPFQAAYAATSEQFFEEIERREGHFPDGIPAVSDHLKNKVNIVETRKFLCEESDNHACVSSERHGIFYVDDNHISPEIAPLIPIFDQTNENTG